MENNINLLTEQFKDSIVDIVNSSGLPPAIIYYVMKDIFKDIESGYTNYIEQAKRQAATVASTQHEETSAADEEEEEYLPQD